MSTAEGRLSAASALSAPMRVDRARAATIPLPQPPSDTEKYGYVDRKVHVLVLGSLTSVLFLGISQLRMLASTPFLLYTWGPFLAFTLVYYVISLRVNVAKGDFDLRGHRALVTSWRPTSYPSVDVLLPVCGERIEVLRNTWTHVRALAENYPGPCHPFVLDDLGSPEVRALAEEIGFRYGSREDRGRFKKAGNLRYGLDRTNSPYVLVLDADFAPRTDMLAELLPHLETEERLGIIQSPQFFRVLPSQSWVERGAGAVQEFFYRVVQVSRQRLGGAICVGSCAVYRRSALAENGGTTLIEHSEDVHTGFDLRRLGWDVRYVPIALSAGVCPDEPDAFQRQQYRWCMGSMSLLTSRKFWAHRMRLSTRACYVSGFLYYVHTALATVLFPLVPVTLLLAFPEKVRFEHSWMVLPSVVYALLVFPLWHRAPYRLEAWGVRLLYGWAHFFALVDVVRGRREGWRATGSTQGTGGRGARRRRVVPLVWGALLSLAWISAAVWRSLTGDPADFAMLLVSGLLFTTIVLRTGLPSRRKGVS
ncbi:glycosyltransferase family 2 protein [Streptomyces sp. NPDC090303]|uniref:glycosyltransferase family 2 protein n=1 Tax=Streptomyces sp. NPDC090303 TaxID=3365960 RepID=UPI0037FC9623